MPPPTACQALVEKAWNAQYSSPRDSYAWAQEAMADKSASISLAEAQAELARAMAQLRTIERLRKKR